MIKITLPLKVMLSKKSRKTGKPRYFILNLNAYRNAHHLQLTQAKNKYADIVKLLLSEIEPAIIKFTGPVKLTYTYFAARDNILDTNNPVSIIDKFTCDALTDAGVWDDDNNKVVVRTIFQYGGHDPANPRCELVITDQKMKY
jgi:Holliday junction resolvase RusA-like endonuclease